MVERHKGWTVSVLILFLIFCGCKRESSKSRFFRVDRAYMKPELVKEGEKIELVCRTISEEGNHQLEIQWMRNGFPIESMNSNSFELSSFYFQKGDSISTEVSVIADGEVVRVLDIGPVVCINSPPAVTHIGISALNSTTLKATAEYEDLDGDSVSLVKEWFRNGAPYYNGETLTTTDLHRGDTVCVEVTPSDGEAEGRGVRSNAVVIGNHPPKIVSTPPRIGSNDYVYQIDAEDPDGDALTYDLVQGPDGMAIDHWGSLSWSSGESADSLYLIELQVLDGFGGSAVQKFELQVDKGSAF